MDCIDCGQPTRPRTAYIEITGFVRDRTQGGHNAVALETSTGRLLCTACMSARKSGIARGQGTLGAEGKPE